MSDRNEQAKKWLEEHAAELEQEELPSEKEKMEADLSLNTGRWPEPKSVPNMGVFTDIKDEETFNKIVGNIDSWPTILHRTVLYRNWILPQAILIFGKRWFDRCKWRSSIQRGVQFPLFSEMDRLHAKEAGLNLDVTPAGRVRIARIAARVEHSLFMYLTGGGLTQDEGHTKAPGGYITDSIKNEFMREIADERGYKLTRVRACPYCLAVRKGRSRRVAVVSKGDHYYSCERCEAAVRNIELNLHKMDGTDLAAAEAELERVRVFSYMNGTMSVCPSRNCNGLVPMNAVQDQAWWKTSEGVRVKTFLASYKPLKGSKRFRIPPPELKNVPLVCPYCSKKFTPQSGSYVSTHVAEILTGLPTIFVWRGQNLDWLDRSPSAKRGDKFGVATSLKDALADDSQDIEGRIAARQRANLLLGELAVRAYESSGDTVPATMSRCFYLGAADWMKSHPDDASAYLLDWETECDADGKPSTKVVRGQQGSVHQTILHAWIARIEQALPELRKAKDGRIRSLRDLKWLCQSPTYKNGPRSQFSAKVENGLRVPNKSRLGKLAKNRPRIAWVVSVRGADGTDLTEYVRDYEWHAVLMDAKSGLVPGDKVTVEALMMPGHHCHAPIQRIIRLRTSVLSPIVERIRLEEETGETDSEFWNDWKKRANKAMKIMGIGIPQGVNR